MNSHVGGDSTHPILSDNVRMEQLSLLQQILDRLPQVIFWKDIESVYLGCNSAFAEIAGLSHTSEIVGKCDYDMAWKKEESDFFRECDRRVMDTNTPEYNIIEPLLRADGKQSWLDTTKVPLLDDEGRVVGILGTFVDITVRVEAEQALIKKSEHFEALAQEREVELNALKRIVPICAYCKEIRDESGQWKPIESYLRELSDDAFSHSFCDKCMEKHYGSLE